MMTIAQAYSFSGFRERFERDREYWTILAIVFLIGLLLMYLLATYHFLMQTTAAPERYARIAVGPSGLEGKLAGGGAGAGNGRGKDAGMSKANKGGGPGSTLLGVIASRSSHGQSALGRVLGNKGLGAGLDRVVGMVQRGNGGVGNQENGLGSGRSRGHGAGELGEGSGLGGHGIGKVGTGYGGGGDDVDLGIRPTRSVYAHLEHGKASVEGSLDSSLIENVVRQNLAGLRYCYEKELNVTPNLAGKIVVQFTIGLEGDITVVDLLSTSLKHALAEDCIVRRIKRWRFPRPQGGNVIVSYPFIFSPST